jgi:hypothetical protein
MAETNEREKLERALFLAEAGEHIADTDVRIAGVQAHIAELELGGRDASEALKALEALEGALPQIATAGFFNERASAGRPCARTLCHVQRLVAGQRRDRLNGEPASDAAVYMPTRPLWPLYLAATAAV